MKPDVIVSWPKNCDYPLWRRFITQERDRFARVFVVFTENGLLEYRDFVRRVLPDVEFIQSPERGDRDWRDVAVSAALDASDAEWVWFTEQDFFIHNPDAFWPAISLGILEHDAVGWHEWNDRWHPSCLFVRRSEIDRTERYFGPEPVDHFYRFGSQLRDPFDLGAVLQRPTDFEHLQGLSQNHWLTETRPNDEGIFARDRFRRYLADCLVAGVALNPTWEMYARRELEGVA